MADTIFYYSDETTSISSDTTITFYSRDTSKTLIKVIIGDSVTAISATLTPQGSVVGPFNNSTSLTNVTILSNILTFLAQGVFSNCSSLTSINLPDSLTSLPRNAFFSCTSLTKITIPRNITVVGVACFSNCINLNRINFLGNAPNFGTNCFNNTNANLKLYRKKNFVTGWVSSVQNIPVNIWSDNVIKGGGTEKLIGKSFIRKVIITNAQDGGNGTYIRNNENDIFIGPFDPEFNLYDKIKYFPNYYPNQGMWGLDRDETYYISSDLINWEDGGWIWGNGSAQIFYKP